MTDKGQKTLAQEREAAALFCAAFPGLGYVETPKDKPVILDAMVIKKQTLVAVAECKCRMMTLETFQGAFKSEWLITLAKLEGAAALAETLCVPLIGLLYLVPSKVLLVRGLWEPDSGWVVPYAIRTTETQATVNGGLAVRENAFVDMRNAKQITAPQ